MMVKYKKLRIEDLNELMDVLDETEGKAIIWANYVYDIENIVKTIKAQYGEDSVVQYYGAIPSEKRQNNIEKFQDMNSKVRFLLVIHKQEVMVLL
jgi:superfamily II DNA helicase RecQ